MLRDWAKSSHSMKEHIACVEVGAWEGDPSVQVGVRDTENRHLGHLAFGAGEFAALIGGVR